jgi:hypothetical protein
MHIFLNVIVFCIKLPHSDSDCFFHSDGVGSAMDIDDDEPTDK